MPNRSSAMENGGIESNSTGKGVGRCTCFYLRLYCRHMRRASSHPHTHTHIHIKKGMYSTGALQGVHPTAKWRKIHHQQATNTERSPVRLLCGAVVANCARCCSHIDDTFPDYYREQFSKNPSHPNVLQLNVSPSLFALCLQQRPVLEY